MRAVASTALTLVLMLSMVAVWLAASNSRSYACSCIPPGTPTEEMARSTAVFTASVVNIVEVDPRTGPIISSADPLKVTFQVDTVWKGTAQETLVATTARNGASCGYEFEEGQKYLVYALGSESELEVSLCSRTAPLALAGIDLNELGQGRAPEAAESPVKDNSSRSFGCSAPLHARLLTQDISLAAIFAGLLGLSRWRKPR